MRFKNGVEVRNSRDTEIKDDVKRWMRRMRKEVAHIQMGGKMKTHEVKHIKMGWGLTDTENGLTKMGGERNVVTGLRYRETMGTIISQ
ncbi:hypothetical protein PoB_000462800 [Plakobranchus ocellatus]|uniref:Uncharacterized protein n=1 Tax=Plakobranchus ocellatus TaxID=259542 RepID=A0AAV3Y6E9_9GAST|nr:hypothetical protein PoB_000462800 [Plakobranchus ocellatus]